MASGVKYLQISGRDELIPVFRNLSRSVVKRGAGKIYWRMRATAENGVGCWNDEVWLDCATGDVRFGERCVREGWSDVYDEAIERGKKRNGAAWRKPIAYCPFDKDFALEAWEDEAPGEPRSYWGARKRWDSQVYAWPLGVLSEWRGADSEIEPRLAARLAEAAEFNFGLDFTGPEEEHPFLESANEIVRFYEALRRKNAEYDEDEGDEDESEFPYWESETAFEDWRREEKSNEEIDEKKGFEYWDNDEFASVEEGEYATPSANKNPRGETYIPIYWNAAKTEKRRKFYRGGKIVGEEPLRIYFDCSPLELGKDAEAKRDELSEEARTVAFASKSEARLRSLKRGFEFGGNWWAETREPVFLGSLNCLIAVAQAGTSGRTEPPKYVETEDGEIVADCGAERADVFSDDWRERLPSLLDFRYDYYRVLFDAAKTVYVGVVGTPTREMRKLEVWTTPGCDKTTLCAGRPEGANWLKLGTIADFYNLKRGQYWGANVKKSEKICLRSEARHWTAQEIGRRLEAALKAKNGGF